MTHIGPYKLNSIVTGDTRELAKAIPDESVDLIFTDPPYTRASIHLYGWLAEFATRALKPDGFLIAYTGQYWKDEVMALFRPHLEYYWDFVLKNGGDSPVMWNRRIVSRNKSLLCYRPKGGRGLPICNVISDFNGMGADKRYHRWGQEAESARYYLECFSRPEDIVLDPFLGGGTTAYVCQQLGRLWLGFEIDPAAAEIARARMKVVQPLLFQLQPKTLRMEGM